MKFSLKGTQELKPSLNISTKWWGFLQTTGEKSPLNATTLKTGERRSDWEKCQGKYLMKWRDLYSMKPLMKKINEYKITHLTQHAVKKMSGPCTLGTAKRIAFTISKNSLPRCWESHKALSELLFWISALSPFPKEGWDQCRAAAQQLGAVHSLVARGSIFPVVTAWHLSRCCFLLRHTEIP